MRICGVELHRAGPPAPFAELRRLLALLDVDHVVDVGANRGQYATALRNIGFSGRIDCVEPQPRCAAELRRRSDVSVHEVAVGAAPGEQVLHIYRDDSLSSLHELNALGRNVWEARETADEVAQFAVAVITLDELFGRITLGGRLWLKLDTQGNDLEAIRGLSSKYLPLVVGIQTEIAFSRIYDHAPLPWIHLEALAERGFTLAGLTPIGRVAGGAIIEADCFFARSP